MAERDKVTMTTQEKLLAEAWEFWKANPKQPAYMMQFAADFALSQLRAAKESGHLRHKGGCRSYWPPGEQETYSCSCGFAERFGDL